MTSSRNKIASIALSVLAIGLFTLVLSSTLFGKMTFVSSNSGGGSLLTTIAEGATGNRVDKAISPDTPALYTLSIPRIKVKAKVDGVGITKAGAMATPANVSHVGWYKFGTTPGAVGTAVFAGHVNNALLLPGTFYNLKDLQEGDDVYVTDAKGKKLHFVVTEATSYNYKETETESIFGDTGVPLLKLITCEGKWINAEHTYDHRLVVTAELVV